MVTTPASEPARTARTHMMYSPAEPTALCGATDGALTRDEHEITCPECESAHEQLIVAEFEMVNEWDGDDR